MAHLLGGRWEALAKRISSLRPKYFGVDNLAKKGHNRGGVKRAQAQLAGSGSYVLLQLIFGEIVASRRNILEASHPGNLSSRKFLLHDTRFSNITSRYARLLEDFSHALSSPRKILLVL